MANLTFNVLFYVLKNKLLKNGEAPIYARVTVKGIRKEFQIKRTIPLELWNQDKECSTGKDKVAKEINGYIEPSVQNFTRSTGNSFWPTRQ